MKNKRLTNSIIVAILGIFILSFSSCKFKGPKEVTRMETEISQLKKDKAKYKKKADACDATIKKIKMDYQAQIDSLKAGPKKTSRSSSVSSGNTRFFVVAGSFQNATYAQNYAQKMAQYDLSVINGAGGFYFVGIGTNDYSEAISLRNTLRGVSVNTWIYQ